MMKMVSRSIFCVRSGLIARQLPPRSVDLNSTSAPVYTTPGVVEEKAIGVFHSQRYRCGRGAGVAGAASKQERGRAAMLGLMLCRCMLARLTRCRLPFCDSEMR